MAESPSNIIQDSPEWHEWRLSGIGASEIAAVMGVCPYNTAYGVWLVKTGRAKGFAGNSFTEHGKALEGTARARYELINMEDMPAACATHPKYTMCLASLDGWNRELRRVLEIKCPKGRSVIDTALLGNVSEHYIPQVQYQLGVTGADQLDFFVFHDETKTDALVKVAPDIGYQGKLFVAAENFWNLYVLTDAPPPLTDRDVKVVEDHQELRSICDEIAMKHMSIPKAKLDDLKRLVVHFGGHPKVRCGKVQVSTVNRSGKFSYYKLTVSDDSEKQGA